jgi:hypothetical protein
VHAGRFAALMVSVLTLCRAKGWDFNTKNIFLLVLHRMVNIIHKQVIFDEV